MIGISATTGKAISGIDHVRQSVRDILSTPIGTRVMRREYGSRLFQLIDAPLNRNTLLDLYSAVAEALDRWEPRISVTSVQITNSSLGSVELELTGVYLPDGSIVTIDGVKV